MELHAFFIRVIFAYVFLLVVLRLSGKETVSHLSGRTLVVTLIIGDLIDDMVLGAVPAATFVAAAGAVIIVRSLVGLAAVHSERVYALVEGDAPLLLDAGRLRRAALRRERISDRDLESLLRLQGIDRAQWLELQAVRLERRGETSALRRSWAEPLQRGETERARGEKA